MFPNDVALQLNCRHFIELTQSRSVRKKTIQIAAFRGAPVLETHTLETNLLKLSASLTLLLNEDRPEVSLESMFRSVEVLVQYDQRQATFNVFNNATIDYLSKTLDQLLQRPDEDLLDTLVSDWVDYGKKVATMKNIYLCYDKSIQNDLTFKTVPVTCMNLFRSIIIWHPVVSAKITAQLLGAVSKERAGFSVDKNLMDFVTFILRDLGVYREVFEEQFLGESTGYLQKESRLIGQDNMEVSSYLWHVQKLIQEEESRSYIQQESICKVITILHREMIEAHLPQILNNGFKSLMDNNALQELKLLYQLLSKVQGAVKCLTEQFEKYVQKLCLTIVGQSSEKSLIQDLIDLKDKLDGIVLQCFQANPTFYDLVKSNFHKAINLESSQSALYLARYFDGKLRAKNITEEDLEATFNKGMIMFRFLQSKDIFEAFYRKCLSKRLLFGRSTNQDIEHSIVLKMKEECGEGFTSKIEGMLRDMNLSKEINSNFKEFLSNTQPTLLDKCDISVAVLTSSFWTKMKSNSCIILPDDLLNYQAIFAKYYTSIHSGRKLDWQPHLGHCIIRATLGAAVKELVVSFFQAITLLLFQESSRLTSAEIEELTKMDRKDLLMTLHSLSCGKFQILIKQPPTGSVTMEDLFELNREFKEKLFRIKINQAQLKESVDEVKCTEKRVLADRQFQMDAAIVRILKSRKVLIHNELVSELFKLLDVPMCPQTLKTRIGLLIEKEYIKSDCNNPATYTYVA